MTSFEKLNISKKASKFMILVFYAFGNTEIVNKMIPSNIEKQETENSIENPIEHILKK